MNWKKLFWDYNIYAVAVGTLLILIAANICTDRLTVKQLYDMGVKVQKFYHRAFDAEKGDDVDKRDLLTTFDNSQLFYILNYAVGAQVETEWGNLSGASSSDHDRRVKALRALVDDYGIVFDGPYRESGGRSVGPGCNPALRYVLRVFKYDKGSLQAAKVSELMESGNFKFPHNVAQEYPAAIATIRSQGTILREAKLTFELEMWDDKKQQVAKSPPEALFERSSFWGIQPVKVLREPEEAAAELVETMNLMGGVGTHVSARSIVVSGLFRKLDQSERSSVERLFTAIFRVVLSDSVSAFDPNTKNTGGEQKLTDSSPEIKRTLTERLRMARILNGVNSAGIINFLIFVILFWGVFSLFGPYNHNTESILSRVYALINILPMLGFLGTLYGMLLAFSSVGVGGKGAELISMIGISLDTTLLAVSSAIILSLFVMWKERASQ